jgi:MoaA/NifB/PqqE/SkfB family radical SAM enzyme
MKSSALIFKQAIKGIYKLPFFELARLSPKFMDLIPMSPMRAGIYITYNCNSRCITCHHWKKKPQDELSITELKDTLRQLREIGIEDLNLCGGEPLLRDDLSAVVGYARDLKFDRTSITTNGLVLTPEKIDELVENGLNSILISLNGSEDVHDMTRGMKGAYAKTMEAIKTLVHLRNSKYSHLEINVATIVMGTTIDQIIDIVSMCRNLNIGVSLSPLNTSRPWMSDIPADLKYINQEQLNRVVTELHDIKRASNKTLSDSHASLEYVKDYFTDPRRETIPCYLGYLVVRVGPHGEVFPACSTLPSVGNLRQEPLKQIIVSKPYKERVRDMFLKKCPGCACDHIINLYAHTPSIIEEIKWRLRLN